MVVSIRSPSGDGDPVRLDDYESIEAFLEAYRDQLEDDFGDVTIEDENDILEGESGYIDYRYTDRDGEEVWISLLVLRGAEGETPTIFPFNFT